MLTGHLLQYKLVQFAHCRGISPVEPHAGVGFVPLDKLVIEAKRCLNSRAFKNRFPESGVDVKVLGVLRVRCLGVTAAMPSCTDF